MSELSVVVPVYGCAACLSALHERLCAALGEITDDFEIVYVDDRSPDGAWDVLRELAAGQDCATKVVRLSRNFGQSIAITAGIAEAVGEWIVLIDCDLQDDPADIAALYREARAGHEIVFSRRSNRDEGWFRRVAARAYFRVRNRLLDLDMDTEHGSLMLFSRRVAGAYLQVQDRDRHHALILHWLGFDPAYVDVRRGPRYQGRSAYTLRTLLASAFDGLFFQTSVLLRWIVYSGFAVVALGILLAAALVTLSFAAHPPPGWTSLAVLILVIGGFIILSSGVGALYIGKIFNQVKARPLYVIDETLDAATADRVPARARLDDSGG
ncbi:MAG TPA: glycosyltransferase family 2 protein [Gaiellaceae bacterium]|nr:glycosyltransferase family 2 protein [Gaiellaceae bacterium]